MKKNDFIAIFVLIIIFLGINPLFSQKPFLKPSKLFHTLDWSIRFWDYLDFKKNLDVMILGNSRTFYGIQPKLLESEVNSTCFKNNKSFGIEVKSLATKGGYFPLYETFLKKMLQPSQLPKTLIFGLSPRDFNEHQIDSNLPNESLINSYAYQAKFLNKFNLIHQLSQNLYAALFPMIYFRSTFADTFNDLREQNIIYKTKLYEWAMQLNGLSNLNYSYFKSELGEDYLGKKQPLPEKLQSELRHKLKSWLEDKKIQQERNVRPPSSQFSIDRSSLSLHMQLFKYLKDSGVTVVLITIPSVKLDETESNYVVYNEFIEYLNYLKSEFSNIKSVIDLNNGFKHQYYNSKYYFDTGEHATQEASMLFTQELSERLLTNNGCSLF